MLSESGAISSGSGPVTSEGDPVISKSGAVSSASGPV